MMSSPGVFPPAWEHLRMVLWDGTVFVLAAGSVWGSWYLWVNMPAPVAPIERLIALLLMVAISVLLVWNVCASLVAYLMVLPILPITVRRMGIAWVERWGTAHSQAILRQRIMRASAAATLMTGLSAPGAMATPGTTEPQPATEPTVASLIQVHHPNSEAAAPLSPITPPAPLLPTPPVPVGTPTLLPTPLTTPPSSAGDPANGTHSGVLQADMRPGTPLRAGSTEYSTQSTYDSPHTLTYTVERGDSLWAISAALTHSNSSADIARATQALYDLNRDIIGDDPDLIHPGTVLHLPELFQEQP